MTAPQVLTQKQFGPLSICRIRSVAGDSVPAYVTWQIVLQCSARLSLQFMVLRFDER